MSIRADADEHLWHQWPSVGQAELRWFIFDVYLSELRSENGQFSESLRPVDQNLALKITYYRSIDADDLLTATQEQWQHLGYDEESIRLWGETLAGIFPSVKEGDTLVFMIRDQQGDFYFRQRGVKRWQRLGQIKAPLFADAFISIWLSPETESPEIRRQLTGVEAG